MNLRDLEDKVSGQNYQNLEFVIIESKLLDGEKIILAFEKSSLKKLREKFPDLVIYFPPEIKELYKHKDDTDLIKKLHLVKKKFKGWIVPSGNTKERRFKNGEPIRHQGFRSQNQAC